MMKLGDLSRDINHMADDVQGDAGGKTSVIARDKP